MEYERPWGLNGEVEFAHHVGSRNADGNGEMWLEDCSKCNLEIKTIKTRVLPKKDMKKDTKTSGQCYTPYIAMAKMMKMT